MTVAGLSGWIVMEHELNAWGIPTRQTRVATFSAYLSAQSQGGRRAFGIGSLGLWTDRTDDRLCGGLDGDGLGYGDALYPRSVPGRPSATLIASKRGTHPTPRRTGCPLREAVGPGPGNRARPGRELRPCGSGAMNFIRKVGLRMNVVLIISDSLNRHFLKAYGQPIEIDVATPNLDRLAERGVVFDNHFAGSLPCMPARRELMAGIQEFLWRPWGPLEPFDQPLARLLRAEGAVTQLITDHYHYFQHGSHGFYEDYQGFEFVRGHELDAWHTAPSHPDAGLLRQLRVDPNQAPTSYSRIGYARNAAGFRREEDFLAPRVFRLAAEWLSANHDQTPFFLVIDSFDVHEPFHVPDAYAAMYTDEPIDDPELVKWPHYGNVREPGPAALSARQVAFVRAQYAGKVTMMDRWLGKVFDQLDALDAWDDTMVIFTTDHGHYLGEKGWMGKPQCPNYTILSRIPLIIWHPQGLHGTRIPALTSAVDVYATVLDAMGSTPPAAPHSRSLLPLILGRSTTVRDWALFGYFGGPINVTDGRYTYHRAPDPSQPLYLYSTMYMNPNNWFSPVKIPERAECGRFLPYTDALVWKYPAPGGYPAHDELLFDLTADPWQAHNLAASLERDRMEQLLAHALGALNAPRELYPRFHLDPPESP